MPLHLPVVVLLTTGGFKEAADSWPGVDFCLFSSAAVVKYVWLAAVFGVDA